MLRKSALALSSCQVHVEPPQKVGRHGECVRTRRARNPRALHQSASASLDAKWNSFKQRFDKAINGHLENMRIALLEGDRCDALR